jgi:hypothetical protein
LPHFPTRLAFSLVVTPSAVLHFDIKDGKIWLQHNATDTDVGQELIEMGVAKEDIVLGLHPPYKRPYTGYGVA